MIGVIARNGESAGVEEFFELFKTPWEFYRPDQRYDVVIAAGDELPQVNAKLLLICSARIEASDKPFGVVAGPRVHKASLDYRGIAVPIYGELLTFDDSSRGVACVKAGSATVGLEIRSPQVMVLRLGYNLFHEVQLLLSVPQPVERAHVPTLECHIAMLRNWILSAGIGFLEIPPCPAGSSFFVCLTHDIDFIGIRQHKFDHSMWGFLYRSTMVATLNVLRRRLSINRLLKTWRAVLCLPFVYLGWAKDFWFPFDWYLEVEEGLPATYFLMPFKRRSGSKVDSKDASKRATAYDITDLTQWTSILRMRGYEIGVHGIDSWHDAEKGREELARIAPDNREGQVGVRMHWLLHDQKTFGILEKSGYAYDSTLGYNETIGYRNGTTQAFRPAGAHTLLELPLHIQDGALFYPQRLNLTEPEAWERCAELIRNGKTFGGVLTVLWHDRSHGPERFWGDFYVRLIEELKFLDAWFGTAGQVVGWFQKRRGVRFESVRTSPGASVRVSYDGDEICPPLALRVYEPSPNYGRVARSGPATREFVDIPWNGKSVEELQLPIDVSVQRQAS
jgi:hypothetical protein